MELCRNARQDADPLIAEQLPPEQIPYRLHGPNWVVFAGVEYEHALDALRETLPLTVEANPAAAPNPTIRARTPAQNRTLSPRLPRGSAVTPPFTPGI